MALNVSRKGGAKSLISSATKRGSHIWKSEIGSVKSNVGSFREDKLATESDEEEAAGIQEDVLELRKVLRDRKLAREAHIDKMKQSSKSLESQSSSEEEEPREKSISVVDKPKKKKYEWMDSDDESISGDTTEEEQEEEYLLLQEKKIKEVPVVAEPATTEPVIIEDKKDENGDEDSQYADVKCICVSNISWDATLSELRTFLETSGLNPPLKVLELVKHPVYAQNVVRPPPPIPPTGPINALVAPHRPPERPSHTLYSKTDHTGRAFAELDSYVAVVQAQALNDVMFAGRPLRITKAYKRGATYYLLDTPAHYRFYYQKPTGYPNVRGDKVRPQKRARMDGGYNWSR